MRLGQLGDVDGDVELRVGAGEDALDRHHVGVLSGPRDDVVVGDDRVVGT